MSNDPDIIQLTFTASVPRSHLAALAGLITGRDGDVLLDIENAVNRRLDQVLPDLDFAYKVEFDAPTVSLLGTDVLLTDMVEG